MNKVVPEPQDWSKTHSKVDTKCLGFYYETRTIQMADINGAPITTISQHLGPRNYL
jgi:hypothetical protein